MTHGSLSPVLAALGTALRWWLGELLGCLPAALRRRLTATKTEGVIELTRERIARLWLRKGSETALLDEANLAEGVDDPGRFGRLLDRQRPAALSIQLPAEVALRSIVVLPLAAERNLADAVEFELPRRMPYRTDEVYHAFRVTKRDPANAQLRIELTIATRAVVDEMVGRLAPFGLEPNRVEVAGDARFPLASPDLMSRDRPAGRSPLRSVPASLAGLAVILAIAAVVIPLVQLQQRVDALTQTVAVEKAQADEALKLQSDIRARTLEAGFLGSRKQAAASPTRILDALTKLLPDDTWLSALDVKGDEIAITGSTASASSVIALLDRSDSFRKPSFRSPVTQAPHSGQEQFNIAAQLAGATP